MINLDACCAPFCNRFAEIILRHAKYLISASSYVEKLKNKRDVLDARKNDMNVKIEDAERRSQKPTNEVVAWQKQVDDALHKIDEVVDGYGTRSCLCAICSYYKRGHRCNKMIKEVERLLKGGKRYLCAEMMDCDNSEAPILVSYVVPESLDLDFQDALEYIEDDSSKANVLGIWGKGGVGKTTLLKKIHNSFIGRPMFSHVIWIVASNKASNISRIQSKIIKKLKLKSDEDDDVESKAFVVSNFLRNKNFLLFIDDIWEAVDLHEAGVPIPYEAECGKNSKVVFTTRSKEVCGKMEAKKIIEVKCLDSEKSWFLFKEKVGEQVIQSHPRTSQLAQDVANECKGLPLALITIGRAMSTKSDPNDWKDALELMKKSQGHDILGTDKQLLSILKLSYDFLPNDELRNCFLSISMWPEDFIISKKELIECWMGLDIIENFENLDDAYQIGHYLIRRLLSSSLLENTDYDGVKMHDVLRDLALWIASDYGKNKNRWLVKAGIQLQEAPSIEVKWSDAEYISLMCNYSIKKLPSGIPSCPHLLTLMLQMNRLTCKSIVSCFSKFQSLKYLNLSFNRLDSFPESMCDLPVLQYLNLSYNEIEHIPEKLGNLKKLKYLLLRENRIRSVQRGVFSELVKLLVLDMFNSKGIEGDYLVNVEEIKWLKETLLYLGISVMTEEDFNELLNMSDLRIAALSVNNLHITSFNFMSIIPNPYCLRELTIGHCSDGLVQIIFERNDIHQDLPSINLENLTLDHLYKLERIIWKDIKPKKLFAELKEISIWFCNLIDDITWVIHLPSLRTLEIGGCGNMRIAIKNDGKDNNNYEVEPNILTFPSLRKLLFGDMRNLKKISTRSLAFPELHSLRVYACPLLKRLPVAIESTPKLHMIDGYTKDWWDKLEWEDDNSRSHFRQLFCEW